MQLAPSAFQASAATSSNLSHHILPLHLQRAPLPNFYDAVALWSEGHDQPPPESVASFHQNSWDSVKVSIFVEALLVSAPDASSQVRLLAASAKESGAWLNALPIPSLGLKMDNDTIRIAVGLRLGFSLCRTHTGRHCGAEVDSLATHGLSCRWR